MQVLKSTNFKKIKLGIATATLNCFEKVLLQRSQLLWIIVIVVISAMFCLLVALRFMVCEVNLDF